MMFVEFYVNIEGVLCYIKILFCLFNIKIFFNLGLCNLDNI